MTIENRWLLPQGIEEVLPAQAERIDRLCRELVDCMHSWGYELVMPPLIDYIESLLTGTGNDLSLKTFKLTDQMSGRTMGVRADMTPQVARIDAHSLKRETPSRLCYVGQVLHTRADGFSGNRSPLQVGAELYGYAGLQSDVEVLQLMIEALTITGNSDLYVDLGHVGVYRALVDEAKIDAAQQAQLFDVMQRKAVPELKSLLDSWQLDHGNWMMLFGPC
jgi:ATP phosphoribosyltransferase regulatory subunit